MATTYEKIATTTLGSANATITLDSIASTWTDLRVVLVAQSANGGNAALRINNDSGSNYSYTSVYAGGGGSPSSDRGTSTTSIRLSLGMANIPALYAIDLFSYAGSTYKSCLFTLSDDNNGSGYIWENVGLWRNTAAITRLDFLSLNGTFAAGTSVSLYEIKAA